MKKMVKQAVHKHERAMHPGKPMTKLAKGGVANTQTIKTRGTGAAVRGNKSSTKLG
jgi:hypothetical protein